MTHPLTDEIIRKNFIPDYDHFGEYGEICLGFDYTDLRDAYDKGRDDQLEQVIEWIEETGYDQFWDKKIITATDLKKAMRPREDDS